MDIFDQKEVLKSFQILVDSREQATERADKRYKSFSAPYSRATLDLLGMSLNGFTKILFFRC